MKQYAYNVDGLYYTIAEDDIDTYVQRVIANAGILALEVRQLGGEQLTEDEQKLLNSKATLEQETRAKFKLLVTDERPATTNMQSLEQVWSETDDIIRLSWTIKEFNAQYCIDKIAELKKQLSDTDYIVIKAYEAVIMGEEASDAVKAQIEERRSLREQINELEAQLEAHG